MRDLPSARVRVFRTDAGVDRRWRTTGHAQGAEHHQPRGPNDLAGRAGGSRSDLLLGRPRVEELEPQGLVPIADRKEMGLDHQSMVDRLSAMQGYRPYFAEAFGSNEI